MAQAQMEQMLAGLRNELETTKARLLEEQQARQQLEQNTTISFRAQIPKVEELERQVAALRAGGGGSSEKMDLLNLKHVKPEVFTSREGEAWKPWAKKTKLFLNGKVPGFRAALVAAERLETEIAPGRLDFTDWPLKADADVRLHEFLLHQTTGRALQIAEEPLLDGRGFETWRRMKEEFEPRGGPWEMKVMASLMAPPKAKSLATMYDEVVQWETRIYKWEQRTGKSYPAEFKLTNLHMMVPDEFKEEFDRRFAFESHDYGSLILSLKAYAQQKKYQRFGQAIEKAASRDPNAMDLDAVDWEKELNKAYREGVQHCDEESWEPDYNTGDANLDALMRDRYQQGKAKGKGKGGWRPRKGKGKGDDKDKAGDGGKGGRTPRHNPDIICNGCGEKGHITKDCPQPACDPKNRPCFICKKRGCRADRCPERKNKARPVKAIENGGVGDSRGPVLMIGMPPVPKPPVSEPDEQGWQKPRKPVKANLKTDVKVAESAKTVGSNRGVRFRPLLDEDVYELDGELCNVGCCNGSCGCGKTMNGDKIVVGECVNGNADGGESACTAMLELNDHNFPVVSAKGPRKSTKANSKAAMTRWSNERHQLDELRHECEWIAEQLAQPDSDRAEPTALLNRMGTSTPRTRRYAEPSSGGSKQYLYNQVSDVSASEVDGESGRDHASEWIERGDQTRCEVSRKGQLKCCDGENYGECVDFGKPATSTTPVQSVPISLFDFGTRTAEIMSNETWTDIEMEVALDSGSVVHVASDADIPCHLLDTYAAARPCEGFIVGDGGTMKSYFQETLNLKSGMGQFTFVFQIAVAHRPLMSVGRICDQGHSITFNAVMAVVHATDGSELCRFERQSGGLYVAKLKLRNPLGLGGPE